ncbi:MAG: hypothetical protein K1X67_05460 [Fimbriimonadaceae bacterium]|nr:hypothetical protein [Fimbriimonadaceae bacterium]
MNKPSKKQIKEAVEKLKGKSVDKSGPIDPNSAGKLSPKKSSQRIRKQGV